MPKITLTDLTTLTNQTSAVTTINDNNADIETAFENTLSRDGTSPNAMEADFDMNDFQILNLPTPVDPTDVVRLQDLEDAIDLITLAGDDTSIQKVQVVKNSGAVVGTRKQLNFIEGSGITLTVADDVGNNQVDITITGASTYVHPDHTGDVTSVADGAQTIAANAVTNTKLADMAANSLKGNNTGSAGDPVDLTVSEVKSLLNYTYSDVSAQQSSANLTQVASLGGIGFVVRKSDGSFIERFLDTVPGEISVTNGNGDSGNPTIGIPNNTISTAKIADDNVTYAKLQNVGANSVLARSANTSGDVGEVVVGTSQLLGRGASGDIAPIVLGTNLSMSGTTLNASGGGGGLSDGDYGDITVSGTATVFTVDNDVITNAKLANMATQTFKGRTTAGTGDPEDLTATQATALLNVMVGDSGAGGAKGLVPAQVAGDSTKFLRGDGTFQTIPGGGDALTSGNLSQFASTTSAQLATVISDETGSGSLVFATSPTLTTPILGTPTSGTLTNCTGLPVSGITASTSTALGVGSIELGHATDTTIARSSAGVATIEGARIQTAMIGEIKIWPTGTVPTNCLECNGAAVSRTTYAALFAVIGEEWGQGDNSTTFNLPDMRGEFLRGWDHAAGHDPDAASRTAITTGGNSGDNPGSKQGSDYLAHSHTLGLNVLSTTAVGGASGRVTGSGSSITPSTSTMPSSGGNETRPRNVNVMYVIVYQ